MAMVMSQLSREKRASLNSKLLFGRRTAMVIQGACIVKKFNEKPLYKPSAGKILVYNDEKKETDIIFRQPPKETPVFKEGVILSVFKK